MTQARLPWSAPSASASTAKDPAGTYDLSRSPNTTATALPSDLTPSTNPSSAAHLDQGHTVDIASTAATPGRSGVASTTASGTSTPNSAGFVSLASLGAVNGKLRKNRAGGVKTGSTLSLSSLRNAVTEETDDAASDERGSALPMDGSEGDGDVSSGSQQVDGETEGEEGQDGGETPVYLQYDPSEGLDREKYAVLPNDWPYNIPYGVRHYCVWSRVSDLLLLSPLQTPSPRLGRFPAFSARTPCPHLSPILTPVYPLVQVEDRSLIQGSNRTPRTRRL